MYREANSPFAFNAIDVNIERSRMTRPSGHKFSCNSSDLVPVYIDEILAGDTLTLDLGAVVRMATPLHPVMDTAYADFYFFFVPFRLLWEHYEEFMGANKTTYWTQPVEYTIPQISAPENGWQFGTVADYMGIPPSVDGFSVSALPFRAYALIWNEWFRDQNVQQPVSIDFGDSTVTGSNKTWADYITDGSLGGFPLRANRFHDYFSSSLPSPQKGPDVLLPLGDLAPVIPYEDRLVFGQQTATKIVNNNTGEYFNNLRSLTVSDQGSLGGLSGVSGTPAIAYFANLGADLSSASAATVNDLRRAFAIQRIYEQQARGGSRFIEVLKASFGVESPDARLQRPEYLGGSRVPIEMQQIVQNSATQDGTTPLGQTGAFSLTGHADSLFTHSFVEPGYVIGLMTIRNVNSYQQGLERFWSRKDKFDFYWPALAHLGNMPVYNREIFLQSDSVVDSDGDVVNDQPFGYVEAWSDYRAKPSRVSGMLRSSYPQTLDSWHYADDYSELPILSSDWMVAPTSNIARTLAVLDTHQFIADLWFDVSMVRPMPLYSIPGLDTHF